MPVASAVTLESLFAKYKASDDARMRYSFLTQSLVDEPEVVEKFINDDLCVAALAHYQSTTADLCDRCKQGKNVSQWACSVCALKEGLCSVCKKVVDFKKLDIPDKGIAACLALLTNPKLLARCFPLPEPKEESKEVEGQEGEGDDSDEDEGDVDISHDDIREQMDVMLSLFFG